MLSKDWEAMPTQMQKKQTMSTAFRPKGNLGSWFGSNSWFQSHFLPWTYHTHAPHTKCDCSPFFAVFRRFLCARLLYRSNMLELISAWRSVVRTWALTPDPTIMCCVVVNNQYVAQCTPHQSISPFFCRFFGQCGRVHNMYATSCFNKSVVLWEHGYWPSPQPWCVVVMVNVITCTPCITQKYIEKRRKTVHHA